MVFCLLAGCSDMHGKNISFARTSGGFMPAPVYDLANARIIDGIDSSLAMSVGGCRRFEDIDAFFRRRTAWGLRWMKPVPL